MRTLSAAVRATEQRGRRTLFEPTRKETAVCLPFMRRVLACHHEDDDDLTFPPVGAANKEWASECYFRLSFHYLFGSFDKQQSDQIFPVRCHGQTRQYHLNVPGRNQQILGLIYQNDFALRDHAI